MNNIDEKKIFNIKNTKFYLPHYPEDLISRCIVQYNEYWDNWQGGALGIIDKYLPDNANIIDIGANIGSHTMYWAKERNAKHVYSFEPFPDTFDILKQNIELNNLQNKVTLYNVGLSDRQERCSIRQFDTKNIGGTGFMPDEDGEFEFKLLDEFVFPEKIDLIKIDVEGFEILTLNGAMGTINVDKPIIVIETFSYKQQVDHFMNAFGYKLVETIRENADFIYKYSEE